MLERQYAFSFGEPQLDPDRKYEIDLRDYQKDAIDELNKQWANGKKRLILCAPTGSGKCLGVGTPVMLASGEVCPVEKISVGDRLMGPDGQARTVQSVARDRGPMIEVIPTKGDPWRCNDVHILTLVRTGEPDNPSQRKRNRDGEIVDVSVSDWRTWSRYRKHIYKLFRVGVDNFDDAIETLPVEPYLLGVLLGDGSIRQSSPRITTADSEIAEEVSRSAQAIGCEVREDQTRSAATDYRFVTARGKRNPLLDAIRLLGLWGKGSHDKFIPQAYKTTAVSNRLDLLAGLIDTDGSLAGGYFDLVSASEQLANDVVFVARSLGFSAYVRLKRQNYRGEKRTYYRVSISGNIDRIPTRVKRKQAPPRRQKKNVLRTGFKIREIGDDWYYGFTLDGDGRFLLGDFTVTHNTELAAHLMKEAYLNGRTAAYICDRVVLVDQAIDRFGGYGIPFGVIQGARTRGEGRRIVIASEQTLASRGWSQEYDLVIVDEAHVQHKTVLEHIVTRNMRAVGLTATPLVKGLAKTYDGIVTVQTTNKLIEKGWIVPLRVYCGVPKNTRTGEKQGITTIDMKGAKTQGGEWTAGEVDRRAAAQEIYGDAVAEWEKMTRKHFDGPVKTLVFSASVASGTEICNEFQEAGYDFRQVSYMDRDADAFRSLIREFRDGDVMGLVSCEVLTKGVDIPNARCIVGLRPYKKSLAAHIQQIGRVMRPAEDKKYGLVLDHAGNFLGFGERTSDFFENSIHKLPSDDAVKKQKRKSDDAVQSKMCHLCGFVLSPGDKTCPSCGAAIPQPKGNIASVPGRMTEFDLNTRVRLRREWQHRKLEVWGSMVTYAHYVAIRDNPVRAMKFAKANYHELYDEWPKWAWNDIQPGQYAIDSDVAALVKLQSKAYWARKRGAEKAKSRLVGSRNGS